MFNQIVFLAEKWRTLSGSTERNRTETFRYYIHAILTTHVNSVINF